MGILFPDDAGARVRRDRVLAILFAAMLALLVARAARKDGGVLVRNQGFGARFVQRVDPYFEPVEGHRVYGPYPPSFALVAAPLSALPIPVARVVWGSLQALALLAIWRLLRRWTRLHWPSLEPHAPMIFALAVLLASRYLLRDTAAGGGNLLFALLAMFGLDRIFAGRTAVGGASLALSLVLKPNLAPFLLFLTCRRRWSAMASTLVAAVALFLLPAAWFGWGSYLDISSRWARDVVAYARIDDLGRADRVPDGMPLPQMAMNQSLREAVHRLVRPPGDSGAPDVHVVETSPAVAGAIARGAGILLAALAGLAALRARSGRAELLAALAFLPLALLLSPITWKAHHAALLPLFFALVCEARAGRKVAAFLFVYWIACGLLSEEIAGSNAKEVLQSLSVVTWGNVALLGATLALARRARTSILTNANRVWNRAAMEAGGESPGPGDRALASLLRLHGLVMNGGVHHAIECLERAEVLAAADGYAFFGCDDVAAFFRGAEDDPILAAWTADTEGPANRRYTEMVPDDSYLAARFEEAYRETPGLFASIHHA